MCIFKINYIGRSNNNLLQVISAINYCLDNNIYKIIVPNHQLFELNTNIIVKNGCKCNKIFNKIPINNTYIDNNITLCEYKKLSNKYIKHKFLNTNIYQDMIYDIGIHIRSGDTFDKNPHSFYIPLPLSYYKKILSCNINKNIIIVYEDDKNPVINLLINEYRHYKNIYFQSSALINDIISLSNCKNLYISIGTFFYIPYIISKTIQEVFIPSLIKGKTKFGNLKGKNINIIELSNYINLGEWKNTIYQTNLIINYKL